MAKRIWPNKCEDCYDEKKLLTCTGDLVPNGASAELCEECAERRRARVATGLPPDPIGLPALGTWQDVGSITVLLQDGTRVYVMVKFLCDGEDVGIARLKFQGQNKWMAAGAFCRSPIPALSSAKHFLREYYFPGRPLQFLDDTAPSSPQPR
jgi:hypothetical protein